MLFYELLESNEQEMTVMKKLISSALISWFVVFAVSANAGSYEDGVTAYERKDYVTAAKLMRVAADQGDSFAQSNLGLMYANGQGVTQDYKEAVRFYRLSADQGNADAQFYLGFMYEVGQGVTQDYVRAHMWLNISASSGDKNAKSKRDIIAKQMSPTQIEKAQDMARRCQSSNFKNCD